MDMLRRLISCRIIYYLLLLLSSHTTISMYVITESLWMKKNVAYTLVVRSVRHITKWKHYRKLKTQSRYTYIYEILNLHSPHKIQKLQRTNMQKATSIVLQINNTVQINPNSCTLVKSKCHVNSSTADGTTTSLTEHFVKPKLHYTVRIWHDTTCCGLVYRAYDTADYLDMSRWSDSP